MGNTFSIIAFYKEISQQRSVDLSYFLDRTPGSLFKIWNKRRGACWEEGAQSKGGGGGGCLISNRRKRQKLKRTDNANKGTLQGHEINEMEKKVFFCTDSAVVEA